ncbi:hypothetical protein IWQ60_001231 [Tieghemiomyces parasiticus]|uniref:Uncharacterized protein n=1 Tax=Tieghemiomyces parasiticus TaxID=78921 RepID=A0A9W8ADE0_9FUNG|nr:hypothetical protein IWQ60_001231 [Tieghemiomyces parasiticus]
MRPTACRPGASFVLRVSLVLFCCVLTCNSFYSTPTSKTHTGTTERYFTQRTDHFDPDSTATFSQRVFINQAHFRSHGPVLLFLGGQSPLTTSDANWPVLLDLARETEGLIVALEHRYYGQSRPSDDLSTANLQRLSADQAVEDVRYLIHSGYLSHLVPEVRSTNGEGSKHLAFDMTGGASPVAPGPLAGRTLSPPANPWILVGAAYGGSLGVWTKHRYPTLVEAVVAISAPLQTSTDFYQFDLISSAELPCASDIHDAIVYIDNVHFADAAGFAAFGERFNMTHLGEDPPVVADFLAQPLTEALTYASLDHFSTATVPRAPTDSLCRTFAEAGPRASARQKADLYVRWAQQHYPQRQQAWMAGEDVATDRHPAPATHDPTSGRQRLWQTCTQLRYWITAGPLPHSRRLRSALLTPEYFSRQCSVHFPDAPSLIAKLNSSTSDRLAGSAAPSQFTMEGVAEVQHTDGILYIDGGRDPWRPLTANAATSVTGQTSPPLVTTAHHGPPCDRCAKVVIPDEGHSPLFRWTVTRRMQPFHRQVYDVIKRWLGLVSATSASSGAGFSSPLGNAAVADAVTPLVTTSRPTSAAHGVDTADHRDSTNAERKGSGKSTSSSSATLSPSNLVTSFFAAGGEYSSSLHDSLASIFPDVPPARPRNGRPRSLRRRHPFAPPAPAFSSSLSPSSSGLIYTSPASPLFATGPSADHAVYSSSNQQPGGGGNPRAPFSFDSRAVFIFQITFVILVHLAVEHFSYVFEKNSSVSSTRPNSTSTAATTDGRS